jgi:hypothetical protein
MDKMVEEVDLRLELTSSTVESDTELEVTTENSAKNLSKDSGVNLTPRKSRDMDLKDISFLEQESLDLSDKVTIDEFVSGGSDPIVLLDDDVSEPILINDEVPATNEFIEVDAVGQVDMDNAFVSRKDTAKDIHAEIAVVDYDDPYGFSDDEIELSSDEEAADPTGVSLVCLKRPVPTETTVECLEILDSDEEYPVCLVESNTDLNFKSMNLIL